MQKFTTHKNQRIRNIALACVEKLASTDLQPVPIPLPQRLGTFSSSNETSMMGTVLEELKHSRAEVAALQKHMLQGMKLAQEDTKQLHSTCSQILKQVRDGRTMVRSYNEMHPYLRFGQRKAWESCVHVERHDVYILVDPACYALSLLCFKTCITESFDSHNITRSND